MFNFEKLTGRILNNFLQKYNSSINFIKNGETLRGYKDIAGIFKEVKQYLSAVKNYQRALSIDSNDIESHLNICSIYIEKGLFHSANRVIENLLNLLKADGPLVKIIEDIKKHIPEISIKSVTFYLPCYNQERFIAKCIESILAQSYPIMELLVIDDGSTDRSIEIAERYPVKIIRHNCNKGLAFARNTAIRHAKGDFIASVDTDVVLDEFWLEILMKYFDDPNIAVTGGRLIEANTVTIADRWRQVRMPQGKVGSESIRDTLIFGSNTVIRKEVFNIVGGYNIRLRSNFEDVDLCKRIVDKGYYTIYDPIAICRHLRTDDIKKVVDTCYNWRSPFYQLAGLYATMEKLKLRNINVKKETFKDLQYLVRCKHFDLLYFDYLLYFRSTFKDIIKMTDKIGQGRCASITIFILNSTLSNLKVFFEAGLEKLIGILIDDTKDLLDKLLPQSINEQLNRNISLGCNFCLPIQDEFTQQDLEYIQEVIDGISRLFSSDLVTLKMIQTSAIRAHQEETENPYHVNKRVMLLNPPWSVRGRRGVRAGSRWPFTGVKIADDYLPYTPYPFFLCYLSSLLKQRGILNVIVDAIAEELTDEEFIERVAGYQPDVVVIETSTASYVVDAWWIILIKERVPNCKVILTGSHASAVGIDIIKENPFVDLIIRGEYEIATTELIQRLINNRVDYTDIKGLIYRDESGNIVDQGRTDTIEIDSLPTPERLKTPIYKYNDLFAGMQFPCLQIHASRGCPYGCIFCVWPQALYGNKKYRARDPIKVVDELQEAIDTFGFRSFYFDDDTFNIGKERIIKLCNEILKRKLNLPWGAMARADCVDLEMLKRMREAGLVGIKFGVESANESLIEASGKRLDLQKVRDAVKRCKELGIKTHLTFSFGLPGETSDSIEQTIAFVKELDPDSAQFSITTPFPGTRYYEVLKSQGNLLTEMWEYYDGALYTVVKSNTLSPKDLQNAANRANREFAKFKLAQRCQRS